jgi:hypothetical protein
MLTAMMKKNRPTHTNFLESLIGGLLRFPGVIQPTLKSLIVGILWDWDLISKCEIIILRYPNQIAGPSMENLLIAVGHELLTGRPTEDGGFSAK